MASHNRLGKEAEEMAVTYLVDHGYEILHCNWRYAHCEIDIIATRNNLLHIIEVKSLKASGVRFPEEAVTKKKFKHVLRAADEFLFQHRQFRQVQFDILSIVLNPQMQPEFFVIEDVFL